MQKGTILHHRQQSPNREESHERHGTAASLIDKEAFRPKAQHMTIRQMHDRERIQKSTSNLGCERLKPHDKLEI